MVINPYVNKVVYNNNTLLDLTSVTATANKVKNGITAHDSSGAPIVGSLVVPTSTIIVTAPTGSTVTLTKPDSTVITGIEVSGTWTFNNLDVLGTYTITANLGEKTKTETVLVDVIGIYSVTISYSRLPSEYQEVTYIQSTGTQCINTGVTVNSSVDIECQFEPTTYKHDSSLFGSTTSYNRFTCAVNTNGDPV